MIITGNEDGLMGLMGSVIAILAELVLIPSCEGLVWEQQQRLIVTLTPDINDVAASAAASAAAIVVVVVGVREVTATGHTTSLQYKG